jgi:hypothetical protein
MNRIMKFGRAAFIVACLCFIFNVGGLQAKLVIACEGEGPAGDACVTREGGNYICDCIGANCGKTCSRSISSNCPGGTCKAKTDFETEDGPIN